MQYADSGEDVEVVELARLFFVAERISLRRFRLILSARVFIEEIKAIIDQYRTAQVVSSLLT
jgi:hypothetical protein